MNKKMLMWLAIGVAVYFVFLKKKVTPNQTVRQLVGAVTGESPGILESGVQGVMGEIGGAMGLT